MIPGSNKDHPSFIRSFGYAIEGFFTAVRTERNIKVMLAVGHALPASLRETAKGGIAVAPSALEACRRCGICG